jgi:hypothetical protein
MTPVGLTQRMMVAVRVERRPAAPQSGMETAMAMAMAMVTATAMGTSAAMG